MSHAGDVVLFGGAIEPGETAAAAALRELREESNTLGHPDYVVRHRLGDWTTESGVLVEGFLVDLPASFVDDAQPDLREVHGIGFLRLDRLRDSPPILRYHRVDTRDTQFVDDDETSLFFESPTIDLVNARNGEPWTLWGIAGHMAALAREHILDDAL